MKFYESNLYYIYNQGNNHQKIFFYPSNYLYFLRKVKRFIKPYCEILSYCLLPTCFHFLIYSTPITISKTIHGKNVLSEGFKNLLSSYAKGINVQEKRTGSLFTQNTKSENINYWGFTCFNYIHQLPKLLGHTNRLENWQFGSFRDYCGLRKGTLCNQQLALKLFNIRKEEFFKQSYEMTSKQIQFSNFVRSVAHLRKQ